MKLGSLFDGIGGFPLAASRYGIIPVWASEIEPFPVKVTQKHFPGMKHLGDITQINGGEIEPVDIITFGSPCQDLSIAGKREGLSGERSGLFSHAVRIIREMRAATDGKFPRFAVWENVPGAFSSNKGQDFRAVLEEIAEAEIPMPTSGKWAEAGMVRTERIDIAWRTLDAQYWGVPQRRKRIFLVADFTGQCAGEILFVEPRLSWNFETGGEAGEETAGDVGNGVEGTVEGCLTPWDAQGNGVVSDRGASPALRGGASSGGYPAFNILTEGEGVPKIVGTLTAEGADSKSSHGWKGMCTNQSVDAGYIIPVLHDQGGNRMDISFGVAPTLRAQSHAHEPIIAFGPGGQHDIAHALRSQPSKADKPSSTTYVIQSATMGGNKKQNGLGVTDGPCYTLDCRADHAVAHAVDCRNLYETEELSGTLQSKDNGGYSLNYQNPVRIGYAVRRLTPLECERLQGFPDNWTNIPGASDTARYKAIGNSVAIPCVQFIMRRIKEVIGSTER